MIKLRLSALLPCGLFLVLLSLERGAWGQEASSNGVPQKLLTAAERSGFQKDSRNHEVEALVDRLAATAEHVTRVDFGETIEGRPLIAAIAANPPVKSPDEIANKNGAQQRLTVLLLGNIHAGECAGKEALLALLREIALDPKHPWLKNLVVMVAPNYNADGNQRVGEHHRPGQNGPAAGAGQRENAQGLDLNRDFVKLEAPETRALVQLINQWNPHLLIDTHTTNGSRHRYALTYDIPHNPAAAAAPQEFLRKNLLPAVTRQLEEKNLSTFYYGNFDRRHTRWTTYGYEPRYGTEYVGLRGRLAILSEAYAYISFRQRFEATREFVRACVDYVAEHPQEVRSVLSGEGGNQQDEASSPASIPIKAKLAALAEKVVVKGYEQTRGENSSKENQQPKDYNVKFYGRCQPTAQVARPFAYLLSPEESRVADRLRMHGLKLKQLEQTATLDVETYRVKKIRRASEAFQGHRLTSLETTTRRERREIPAGTYVIETDGPLGVLASWLLEPESADGLATWGFFHHCLQTGRDYPVMRLLEKTKLAASQVKEIKSRQKLDLAQIYGPERRISFGGSFALSLRWLPKSRQYLRRVGRRTLRIDAATGAAEPFYDPRKMQRAFAALAGISQRDARRLSQQLGQLSPDGKATLVTFANDLFHYEFAAGRAKRLTNTKARERFSQFSPDGRMVAFVRDHNLHVVEVESKVERALTAEGNEEVLMGELDWVYQEEIYGRGNYRAFWWSPDSSRIALLKIDQRPTPKYVLTDDIPYSQRIETTRYPLAGDPLSQATLGVAGAAGGDVQWIEDEKNSVAENLIVRVGWTPNSSHVVYQVQNREQTWLDLRKASADGGASTQLLREKSSAWVEVLGQPHWLKDGSFLWLSDRTGQRHVYRVSSDGKKVDAVTRGDWEVRSLYGGDPKEKWAYVLATKDSPIAAHCYRVALNKGDSMHIDRLTTEDGNHSVRFDEQFKYLFAYSSTLHAPVQVRLLTSGGKFVRFVDPNLVDHLPYYDVNPGQFVRAPTRDGGELEAMLIKPPDFDPSRKYPVLCYVYGGPQAATVWDRWGGSTYLWHQMLAQKGYCIWYCDNRAASTKGIKNTWPIYRNMGERELQDIEDGLTWLKKQNWVDEKRIGIWGWSYGGYMAAYALTHSKSFKIGISGAPVTDWRNYDAIYTERYMGLPQNNAQGYQKSSVVRAAKNLHGRLLLIHGTDDDNVHIANTLQLAFALQNAEKQFDLMVYPKNRHGVSRPAQSRHLRKMMTKFILDHL